MARAFVSDLQKPARAVALKSCEHRDKHLVADMIPIDLIIVQDRDRLRRANPSNSVQVTDFAGNSQNAPFAARSEIVCVWYPNWLRQGEAPLMLRGLRSPSPSRRARRSRCCDLSRYRSQGRRSFGRQSAVRAPAALAACCNLAEIPAQPDSVSSLSIPINRKLTCVIR
jgi:hypothetical protein